MFGFNLFESYERVILDSAKLLNNFKLLEPIRIKPFICTLLFMICSGCSQQHVVRHQYPFWGEEIYLETGKRDSPLHMQFLSPEPPDSARACLLIVHGMNEHIGRYEDIANYFSDRYVVTGFDLTGHGLSNPTLLAAHRSIISGNTEYNASNAYQEQSQLRSLEPMRKDMDTALSYLINRCDKIAGNKPRPVFILSHSLGSLVSASWLLHSTHDSLKQRIKGIIFTGPAFSVTRVPGWRGWFQNPFLNFTFYTHEQFLNPHNEPLPLLIFNQLIALVTVPLQDGIIELLSLPGARSLFSPKTPDWVTEYLSDWEDERERYRADNYILRRSILRYVLGIEKEIIQFRSVMDQFDTPYLLIYSENDPITPAWGNTDFSAVTLQNHTDNEIFELAGESHHEQLFSSPVLRKYVLYKIDEWLEKRLTRLEE